VALHGDSILRGAYVALKDGKEVPGRWQRHASAEIKVRRPAYTVHDHTVSGQSLSTMRASFSAENLPRIVVLGSGIAEGWSGGSVSKSLTRLVRTIQAKGSIPIITGYSRQLPNASMDETMLAGRDRADREARMVAEGMKVQFADFGAAGPIEIVDDVHPTEAYSLRLTEQLIAALDRVAPECAASPADS
jgi:hypothetical protein